MVVIGLDLGTSAIKAILVEADGQRVVGSASAPLAVARPHPLWSEQNPDDWWLAARRVLANLRTQAPAAFAAVKAIGLSGQMHGAVLVGADERALTPAILWNDGRASAECRTLERDVPRIADIAGVPPMPGFTAPKLRWLTTHRPEVMAAARHVLGAKDFIRLKLTGDAATDRCEAAGMLLLDEATRDWSAPILAALRLAPGRLPRLYEGPEVTGTVRPAVAADLGLPEGVLVVAGAGDAAAGAIGIGAVEPDDAFLSIGTSGQYFVTTDRYRPAPETLIHAFAHALPERWLQMAALLNGASALAFAARVLAPEAIVTAPDGSIDEGPAIARLLAEVEAGPDQPSPVLFLPYLAGERTPHNDPHARGVWFGMTGATTRADLTRAVLEGVAFAFGEAQDCLAAAGTRVARLGAIGGGTRSVLWMQILASVLDRPISLYQGGETGPAFGAARLALIGLGGSIAAVCTKPAVARVIEPERRLVQAYVDPAVRFMRLYQALRSEFRPT